MVCFSLGLGWTCGLLLCLLDLRWVGYWLFCCAAWFRVVGFLDLVFLAWLVDCCLRVVLGWMDCASIAGFACRVVRWVMVVGLVGVLRWFGGC